MGLQALTFSDELCFMLSWDRAYNLVIQNSRIIPNFLSADYKVSRATNKSKKVIINVII